MPRNLPWLVEASKEKEIKQSNKPSPAPAPRRERDSSPEDLVDSDLNPIRSVTPPQRQARQRDRTPSTSPPPAPPDVEYMRDGYDADDIYMMVEDEFFSTAKTFTQHLHHAEYVRHKKLAASRGAQTLETIARPTDGRTEQSDSLKMNIEARERARKVKDAMRKAGDTSSDEDEDDYMKDPQLAGLMTGDFNVSKDLSGLAKLKSNTRAAAGLEQSPHNVERKKDVFAERETTVKSMASSTAGKASALFKEEEYSTADEDDDLDVLPSVPKQSQRVKGETIDPEHNGWTRYEDGIEVFNPMRKSDVFKSFAHPKGAAFQRDTRQPPESTQRAHDTTKPPHKTASVISPARASATSDFLTKRRAEREKKEREDKRKGRSAIDVPTFLI